MDRAGYAQHASWFSTRRSVDRTSEAAGDPASSAQAPQGREQCPALHRGKGAQPTDSAVWHRSSTDTHQDPSSLRGAMTGFLPPRKRKDKVRVSSTRTFLLTSGLTCAAPRDLNVFDATGPRGDPQCPAGGRCVGKL